MNPNGHRFPAPVASLRKHRPRWNAATITTLRPQVLPYIAARVLEPEQSPCQRACCGTTEEAAPRLLPRGHRAEYRSSVGHLRQALKQPGPPRHLGAARAMRQELPTVVPQDLPDDTNPVLLRAPGGSQNQALPSRPSLNDRLETQGVKGVTGIGSHVVVPLWQREHGLRNLALRVVALYPRQLLGAH